MPGNVIVGLRRGKLPGCVAKVCARCAGRVEISPATLRVAAEMLDPVYLCTICLPLWIHDEGVQKLEFRRLTREQLREISDWQRRN